MSVRCSLDTKMGVKSAFSIPKNSHSASYLSNQRYHSSWVIKQVWKCFSYLHLSVLRTDNLDELNRTFYTMRTVMLQPLPYRIVCSQLCMYSAHIIIACFNQPIRLKEINDDYFHLRPLTILKTHQTIHHPLPRTQWKLLKILVISVTRHSM